MRPMRLQSQEYQRVQAGRGTSVCAAGPAQNETRNRELPDACMSLYMRWEQCRRQISLQRLNRYQSVRALMLHVCSKVMNSFGQAIYMCAGYFFIGYSQEVFLHNGNRSILYLPQIERRPCGMAIKSHSLTVCRYLFSRLFILSHLLP